MPNQLNILFLSPLKLVVKDLAENPRYHIRHLAPVLSQDQVYSFQTGVQYKQKWQNNDTIYVQMVSTFGPMSMRLVDCDGTIYASGVTNLVPNTFYTLPAQLFDMTLSLASVPEGEYYIEVLAGTNPGITYLISEPISIREDWPNTILFEYSNSYNKDGMVFQNGEVFSFRCEAVIQDYDFNSTDVIFDDQTENSQLLSSFGFNTAKLIVANAKGVAPWVGQMVRDIFKMDKVLLDGMQFTKAAGAKLERVSDRLYNLTGYSLDIKEAFARNSLTVINDVPQSNEVQVIYVFDPSAVWGAVGDVVISKKE